MIKYPSHIIITPFFTSTILHKIFNFYIPKIIPENPKISSRKFENTDFFYPYTKNLHPKNLNKKQKFDFLQKKFLPFFTKTVNCGYTCNHNLPFLPFFTVFQKFQKNNFIIVLTKKIIIFAYFNLLLACYIFLFLY